MNVLEELLLLCVIFVFSCHLPLGLLFLKGAHGIFYMQNDLCACCACQFWLITLYLSEKYNEECTLLNAGVTDETKRIYINNGSTKKEREQFRKLREEKKRRTDERETDLATRG